MAGELREAAEIARPQIRSAAIELLWERREVLPEFSEGIVDDVLGVAFDVLFGEGAALMAGELHSPPDDGARARADDVDAEQVRADALADRIAAYAPAGSDLRATARALYSEVESRALLAEAEVDRLRGMLSAHGLDPDCSLCAAGHRPGKPCGEPETFVWADGTIYDASIPGYREATVEERHPRTSGRCGKQVILTGGKVGYCFLDVGHWRPHAAEEPS